MKDKTDLYLSLLRYALRKEGMREGHDYHIARKGGACLTSGMGEYCLQENDDNLWTLYSEERGNKNVTATSLDSHDAIKFFYYCLMNDFGPFKYREEWERDTGLQF